MLCGFYNIDCSSFMKDAEIRFVSEYKTDKVKDFLLSETEKQTIIAYRRADEIRKSCRSSFSWN